MRQLAPASERFLTTYPGDAEGFEWDEGNEEHLADHGITPWEVEEVFWNRPVWVPNKKEQSGDWKMVGRTDGGRRLSIITQIKPAQRVLRAFTGWDCTPGERTRYLRERS